MRLLQTFPALQAWHTASECVVDRMVRQFSCTVQPFGIASSPPDVGMEDLPAVVPAIVTGGPDHPDTLRRRTGGPRWQDQDLVFATELDAANVRRGFRRITRLVDQTGGSALTEKVYRKQLRPIIDGGATIMDRVFPVRGGSCSDRPATNERPGPELLEKLLTRPFGCGRYWDRTSDLFGVNEALSP